jgi:hypothetical protein
MNKRVTFAIGQGLDRNGASIAFRLPELKHTALTQVARKFGGYTAVSGRGGWVDDHGVLIEEKSLTVTVYTTKPYSTVQAMARTLATIFNQSSVMLAVEEIDELEFVNQ